MRRACAIAPRHSYPYHSMYAFGVLCIFSCIRRVGPKDFGVRPTTNLLVMLVSILSECSLESAPGTSSSLDGDGSGSVQESGAISRATSSGGGGGSGSGGSGLSAGTDALRLACLGCLEVCGRISRYYRQSETWILQNSNRRVTRARVN